jgi:hypothetical protein
VSQTGDAARVTGIGQGLAGGLARWRAPRAVNAPGKIITDLAVTLALGGDCLADVGGAAGPATVVRPQWPLTGDLPADQRAPGAHSR